MRVLLVTLPVVLSACAAGACDRAARAYDACAAELEASGDTGSAFVGENPYEDECAAYALPGLDIVGDAVGVDDQYNCFADAFDAADCSTLDGFNAAVSAASGC